MTISYVPQDQRERAARRVRVFFVEINRLQAEKTSGSWPARTMFRTCWRMSLFTPCFRPLLGIVNRLPTPVPQSGYRRLGRLQGDALHVLMPMRA